MKIFAGLLCLGMLLVFTSCNTKCEECSYQVNSKKVTYPELCGNTEDLTPNRMKCDSAAKANKTTCVCQ